MIKNITAALKTIYENLPAILTIIAIIFGAIIKLKKFFRQTKEEQQEQLKEQADKIIQLVKESLLSIVSKAEKEWGSGTGTIKKSWVWEQLQIQQAKLTEFISSGVISKELIDELIETAVDELNDLIKKNQRAAEAVKQQEIKEVAVIEKAAFQTNGGKEL